MSKTKCPRIGGLAVARFDSDNEFDKYESYVCLVTESRGSEMKFVWWSREGSGTAMIEATLPRSRMVRVRLKNSEVLSRNGLVSTLKPSDVEPY